MTFDDIFQAFWTQYRAETDIPASSDPEYIVGLRLANEAISHWATYDGTYWRELFSTFAVEDGGTITTGTKQYDAPGNFKEAAGNVKILDANGKTVQTYPLVDPQEPQFMSDTATHAYFSGNPADGYVLNLNPAPSSSLNGLSIDYPYYKAATELTSGTSISEMADPYFIVHRMLANRFRASRNPYYTDALRDAENALSKMKLDNDSGSWANPYQVKDRSGSVFGV